MNTSYDSSSFLHNLSNTSLCSKRSSFNFARRSASSSLSSVNSANLEYCAACGMSFFATDTKGNGILNTSFDGYAPYKGDIQYRKQGSLIAFETGEAVTYGLYSAQERGTLFIGPGERVYAGMVIGQNGKAEDIELNVCKTKHLTNTRSSSADEALRLTPPRILSLEQALDFIDTDELLEVTPKSLRIRKKILDSRMRKRANMK